MSSRFVSGGTIAGDSSGPPTNSTPDIPVPVSVPATTSSSSSSTTTHTTANPSAPILKAAAAPTTTTTTTSILAPAPTTTSTSTSTRTNNPEWEAAQASLALERRQREEARRRAVEGGDGAGAGGEDKSLYDILQANKAAKQAAFEEANRIRNQFRALDDDEIDFLDGVEERRRAEEERLKRETEEGLEVFRRAQRTSGGGGEEKGLVANGDVNEGLGGDGAEVVAEEWNAVGRKRKREKEGRGLVKGVIKRRTSEGVKEKEVVRPVKEEASNDEKKKKSEVTRRNSETKKQQQTEPAEQRNDGKKIPASTKGEAPAKPQLGLVDYGSDGDDD